MGKKAERAAPPPGGEKRSTLSTDDYADLAAFRRALRQFLRFSESAAREAGLTSRHYQAMLMLRARDGGPEASIDDLAQELLIKHNSAVGLADRLGHEGLVARSRSTADRRRVALRLTNKGRRVLARLAVVHRLELRRVGPQLRRIIGSMP